MDDKIQALENFLMEIEMLDKLESRLSEFNVFETLNIIHNEIRHSNVLAWLMKPLENHGLGETFIRKWLQQIYLDNREYMKNLGFSMLELTTMDLTGIQVMREWRNIDLTIVSEDHKFVIAIENKVGSKELSHQLKKYLETINTEYPSYRKAFVFLTRDGDTPSDKVNWLILTYSEVLEILMKSKDLKKDFINESVEQFLNQYMEILRRSFMGEHELEKICREIYFRHQRALDLIFEYKPDVYSEISQYLVEQVSSRGNFELDVSNKSFTRFVSKDIDALIPKKGEGWTKTKRVLLWEFENRNEKLTLKLIIGPGDQEIREKLYNISAKHNSLFKSRSNSLTGSYTQIYATEILPRNFSQDDIELNKGKIEKKWNQLMVGDINKIHEIIVREYK